VSTCIFTSTSYSKAIQIQTLLVIEVINNTSNKKDAMTPTTSDFHLEIISLYFFFTHSFDDTQGFFGQNMNVLLFYFARDVYR